MTRRIIPALVLAALVASLLVGPAVGADEHVDIDAGPSGLTNDPTPTFAFSVASPGATAECRLDAAGFAACRSPFTAPPLADGAHVFEVRAASGHAYRTFTVDTIAPVIGLSEAVASPATSAAVSFTVDDVGAETVCAVDSAAFSPCVSPYRTPELPNGVHTMRVRATDAAGNTTEETARLEVAAGDVETSISGPQGTTRDRTPQFGLTASRPVTRFECRLDDAEWQSCGSTYVAPPLQAGGHVLQARAIDTAGNVDPTPAERVFNVLHCETSVSFAVIDARAECFRVQEGTYISDGPVQLNGITLNPIAGRSLRFNPARRSVSLGPIQLGVGPLKLFRGEFNYTVPEGEEVVLARIDLATHALTDGPTVPDTEGALDLEGDDGANAWGLEMTGEVVLTLTKGRTQLRGTVKLPKKFTDAEGRSLTGEIVVAADNDNGVRVDSAKITAPTARVGELELHNLWVMFAGRDANLAAPTCNAASPGLRWEGGADAVVLPTPNRLQLENVAFGLADGRFNHAEASIQRETPGIAIGSGVRLSKIAISICAGPPVLLTGRIGLTALADDAGRPGLVVEDAGLRFEGGDPWSLRAEAASAQLDLGLPMRFSDLSLSYSSVGALTFRGTLDLSIGTAVREADEPYLTVSLSTHIDGFIEGRRFNVGFNAKGCFDGRLRVLGVAVPPFDGLCVPVQGVVSSTGIAICGHLGKDFGEVGIGYRWGGDVRLMAGACGLGDWTVAAQTAGASAAAREIVLRGARGAVVAVRGVGRAPAVSLRGPRGELIRTAADPTAARRTRGALTFADRTLRTTYVALDEPSAGRWIVVPERGTPIDRVATAHMRARASIGAQLQRRGRSRILRYRIRRVAGQVVTFFERGRGVARTIARVRGGGRGQTRFRIANGPAGPRRVVALIEQHGLPREQRTVATYTAPRATRPAKPSFVRARFAGGALQLRWGPSPYARRYGVRIVLSDGRRLFYISRRDKRSLRFGVVRRAASAYVRVTALRGDGRPGRAATASVQLRRTRHAP